MCVCVCVCNAMILSGCVPDTSGADIIIPVIKTTVMSTWTLLIITYITCSSFLLSTDVFLVVWRLSISVLRMISCRIFFSIALLTCKMLILHVIGS